MGQCVYLNSCVRDALLCTPFLPPPLLSSTRSPSVSSLLPSACSAGRHAAHRGLSLTCRLPHAHCLSPARLSGSLTRCSLPGHSTLGSLATPGISSLARGLALAATYLLSSSTLPPTTGGWVGICPSSQPPPIPRSMAEIINRSFLASCRESLAPGMARTWPFHFLGQSHSF